MKQQILALVCSLLLAIGLPALCTASQNEQTPEEICAALVPSPLPVKAVAVNPYMADSDN